MDLAPNHLNLNFELPAHAGLTIHQNETTQRLKQQLPNAKNRVIYESLSAEIQHAPTHPVRSQSQPASAVVERGDFRRFALVPPSPLQGRTRGPKIVHLDKLDKPRPSWGQGASSGHI